jgi:hypothetical protein
MIMKNRIKVVTTWIAGGALVLLASGCSSQGEPRNDGSKFEPELEVQQTRAIIHQEEAAGARHESTLRPQHFDGPGLSSLGTAELDLILADSHNCDPLVLYLDIPADTYAQDRRTAIGRYLMDKGGLKTDQIEFKDGPNPASNAWVEDNLAEYARTDTSTGSTYSNGGAGASGGGSSGSSSSSSSGH